MAATVVHPFTERVQDAATAPAKSGRMPELDALRGLMLVWMTLTHLPTRASVYSNQTLGFVSAAEGFIFLSAFLTGRIFSRKLRDNGFKSVAHRLLLRALRLYGYHLALLAVAFTVVATIAVHTQQPSLTGLLDFYLAHPLRGVLTSILLIYRPPLLDILPMYIVMLVISPFALLLGNRYGWKWIVVPSALIWIGAQFGLRMFYYHVTSNWFDLHIPFSALGAFDLFGWQFLWISGLAAGSSSRSSSLERIKSLWPAAAIIFVAFCILRHGPAWDVMNSGAWVAYTDKWHLGLLRLIDFAAMAVLFAAFRTKIAKYLAIPVLLTLGKASLEVFCAQLLICFEALALVGDGTGLSMAPQTAIVLSSLVALYLVGRAFGSANAT